MDLFSSLIKRNCPVCQSSDDHNVIFKENIDIEKLDKLAFASRKMPEFMNLRLVRCPTCELLYAPLLPKKENLSRAYETTHYDSNEEAQCAAKTYASWLKPILAELSEKNEALDVGTGNGSFLDQLLHAGFKNVTGIEPSVDAATAAPEHLKGCIHIGMFNAETLPKNHYDLIAIFQTLEHIDQPLQFFSEAYELLKPGGALMIVAHNYRHWLMRLLGKKSPIIDIEHLQLFSPNSLKFALQQTHFERIQLHALRNNYPLHYWFKLLPLPRKLKETCLKILKNGSARAIGAIPLGVKVGNMVAWAYKPRN